MHCQPYLASENRNDTGSRFLVKIIQSLIPRCTVKYDFSKNECEMNLSFTLIVTKIFIWRIILDRI